MTWALATYVIDACIRSLKEEKMSMKKNIIFIFLLVFIFQINLVESLPTTQCSFTNLMDGSCIFGSGYSWQAPPEEEVPPTEIPPQIPPTQPQVPPAVPPAQAQTQPQAQPQAPPTVINMYFSLVSQFFLISLLAIIAILLLQALLESH